MSFLKYESCKDSGVEWLGNVPGDWVVSSLRHTLEAIYSGLTAPQIEPSETTVPVTRIESISDGFLNRAKLGYISKDDARNDRRLERGDILFSNINSLKVIGNCAIYDGSDEIYAGMNLLVLRPQTNTNHDWLHWLIKSTLFRQQVEALAKPAINQASISQSSLTAIQIALPSKGEQNAISLFLERETVKIDNLISEQERLIELLKEKRQAIISHVVTKGLDPSAPMKNSGVNEIGKVPSHWDVLPLKRVGQFKGGAGFPDQEQGIENQEIHFHKVNALGQADANDFLPDSDNTISRETALRLRAYIFPSNTIVFAKIGAALYLARIRLLYKASCIDNNMMGFIVAPLNSVAYVKYMMELINFELISNPGTVPSLNQNQIENVILPLPPPNEQIKIANYINEQMSKLKALLAATETSISLLRERRSALISAAVTGKIDLRSVTSSKMGAA
jgi:type I restriction enzyme S subunit